MANGWSVIVGLVFVVLANSLAWVFSPKGESRPVWRSSLILGFTFCYLMWAVTFLAQLHPLFVPKSSDRRPHHAH
ncbi:hypothetical protein TEQG_08784 [Trichophyton equinum CBS 127.97]|uniref:Uncharacterized protein n=1 Tax=Trichophyton equinum (strain ATCC MYA-4606 / CBS 127.97) TaxID=559882 RepID=F2Q220_TRIEC|nr:hypothetical protein TEQG_08784 [Trichophyton equinum CBS 127.97]